MTHWDEIIALRDKQRAALREPIVIVKGAKLEQESSPLGILKWFMHPSMVNNALSTMLFYEQELPPGSRSGRLQFQGGQVMFITEGRGHTMVDGVKHPWEAGDVLNLPLRRDGIVVQHVNDDPEKPAKFVAVEPNLLETTTVDRGSGFELLEAAPGFVRGAAS
jgi:gentisate 1,2-dioxygenase